MSINLFHDHVISLAEAARKLPKASRGKKVSLATLFRWSHTGLKRADGTVVRLDVVTIQGKTYTSTRALGRFRAALRGQRPSIR